MFIVLGKNCSFPILFSFLPWEEEDHREIAEGLTSSDPPPGATGCDVGTSSSRTPALFTRLPRTYFYILNSVTSQSLLTCAFLVRPTRTALQNHKQFTSLSPVSLLLHYFVSHNTIFHLRKLIMFIAYWISHQPKCKFFVCLVH